MKEKDKTPEKQLNEAETGNLSEKQFRIVIMKKRRWFKISEKEWGQRLKRNIYQRPRRTKEQTNRDE